MHAPQPRRPRAHRGRNALAPRAFLLGLLLLALPALGLAGCAANAGIDPVLAARVNGRPITLAQYQGMLRYNLATSTGGSGGAAPDWQSPAGRTRLAATEQDALDRLIAIELGREQLAKNHASVPPATRKQISDGLNKSVDSLRQSLKGDPTNAGLRQLVDSLTPDVLNALVDQQALQQSLAGKQIFPKAHLRAIPVNTRADAENLEKQAKAGADFGQLARDHSTDAALGAQGGELGTVFVGQAASSISRAVFGPGGSGQKYVIVPFQNQFVLIEVTDRGASALTDVGSAQEQQGVYQGWLDDVVRPAARVDQFVTTN